MSTVLIVDDSATARLALRRVFETDAAIEVVGEANSASAALRMVRQLDPDLVTMDAHLRDEDGSRR